MILDNETNLKNLLREFRFTKYGEADDGTTCVTLYFKVEQSIFFVTTGTCRYEGLNCFRAVPCWWEIEKYPGFSSMVTAEGLNVIKDYICKLKSSEVNGYVG